MSYLATRLFGSLLPAILVGFTSPALHAALPVKVTIVPGRVGIRVGTAQQFRALVVNTPNPAVKWSVNGVGGGNATVGTINANGLYMAPGVKPSVPILIGAQSVADASATDRAEVVLQALPVRVTLAPSRVPLALGDGYQFKVAVENAMDTSVKWYVSSTLGGDARLGTISQTGLYKAPEKMPDARHIYVKAFSVADPEKYDMAIVSLQRVQVKVSPDRAAIKIGATQQFTSTVLNSVNKQVRWAVNDVIGGNAAIGTISAAGLYTAPARVPSPAVVRVKALSLADPSEFDSAPIFIQEDPTIRVDINPERVSMKLGGTQQYTVEVKNTTNTAVKWLVNDIAGGNATVGTISAAGLFTAPAKMPPSSTLRIKAMSAADPQADDSAVVILQAVKVDIAPEDVTLKPGATQQYRVSVTGAPNTEVKWYVNDIPGGNATLGTISAAGLYTAPVKMPSPSTVRVKAVSVADPDESDTGRVAIRDTDKVEVSVNPDGATVKVGATQQFTAKVTGNANQEVKWFVNDMAGGNATLGTISAAGMYTAPAKLPEPATVTVKAVSVAMPEASDATLVKLQAATPVEVTVSPDGTTVKTGATQQFNAKVTGNTNQEVKWFVNDVAGGNATLGTISAAGMYTAPAKLPEPAMVTVKAVSVAMPEISDTTTVKLQAAAPVEVSVTPDGTTVKSGATQQFAAKVAGNSNQEVKWFVNDVAGGNATLGTISAAGLYTAPVKLPDPASVNVKAVSVAVPEASDTTLVKLQAATQITVTMTPETSTVKAGETQQFSVTVANATDKGVKYLVNDVAGGNTTLGTVSATGLYTAPATPPNPATVTLKAVSVMSADAFDTSAITIGANTPGVTTVTPSIIQPGPFSLTVKGSGFTASTRASFAGVDATVSLVSPTELRVTGNTPAGKLGDMVLLLRSVTPAVPPLLVEVRSYTGDPKVSLKEAHRLLRQATFGPTPEAVDRLQAIGIDAWLNEQFAASAAGAYPTTLDMEGSLEPLQERFMRLAISWPDQLKVKTAWILSQIFVVSGVEVERSEPMVSYQRMLYDNAFANFATILRNVALHPAMGEYLDNVNNGKADPTRGIVPNENFGRELMQLFTVGLQKLNSNGTPMTDSSGAPVPTYDQATVVEMTRALTGWTYNNGRAGQPTSFQPENYTGPMEAVESRHDTGEKILLDGFRIPPGQTAEQDLNMALNNLFAHPNVGPFIAKLLIQHFVTSNPSPDYVGRVAAAFNGSGVRGDIRAVIRAILTDPEASSNLPTFGHLREPVAFMAAQLRPMRPTISDFPFTTDLAVEMGQRIFYSPSVFNYYSPTFRPAGSLILGPEFQLFNTATALIRANFSSETVTEGHYGSVKLDFAPYLQGAADPDFLVNLIDRNIMGEQMSAPMKSAIAEAVRQIPATSLKLRAQLALYLTFTSPQFQVEH